MSHISVCFFKRTIVERPYMKNNPSKAKDPSLISKNESHAKLHVKLNREARFNQFGNKMKRLSGKLIV